METLNTTRRGLSLIELLFVLAITALIIAILLPVLRGAREVAWNVDCQSNLRQMTAAWESVVFDHGGRVPETFSPGNVHQWDNLMMDVVGLKPTTDPAIFCPVAREAYGPLGPRPTSYAVNVLWWEGEPAGNNEGKVWGSLLSPTTYPLFTDPAANTTYNPPLVNYHAGLLPAFDWGMGFIHSGDTCSVAYADGHVVLEPRSVLDVNTDPFGRPLFFFNRDPTADLAAVSTPPHKPPTTLATGWAR
ncbi:MAG: prepilin-type N-terminal cleavage/methylation domain-containing protein [Planctomycetota bacterium]